MKRQTQVRRIINKRKRHTKEKLISLHKISNHPSLQNTQYYSLCTLLSHTNIFNKKTSAADYDADFRTSKLPERKKDLLWWTFGFHKRRRTSWGVEISVFQLEDRTGSWHSTHAVAKRFIPAVTHNRIPADVPNLPTSHLKFSFFQAFKF
jgi:hypothetical protein